MCTCVTYAELAAASLLSSLKKTWSTMWRTPFQRTISGVTIFAVTLPFVTKLPELLNDAPRPSPAAVVSFLPLPSAMSSPEYTLVPLITWFLRMVWRSVVFDVTEERLDWMEENASSFGAKMVTPCTWLRVSSRPAVERALEKEVRLFAAMAAVSSPGTSMTASTTLIVRFPNDVELTTCTGVLHGTEETVSIRVQYVDAALEARK